MNFHGEIRKYLESALQERSLAVATAFFTLARRYQELADKNVRLRKLVDRAEYMDDGETGTRNLRHSGTPHNWTERFETGGASYFRGLATSISDFEARRKLERGARDVFRLEARNRIYRDCLNRVAARYEGDERWQPWLSEYKAEMLTQNECACCGMGCCTCEMCREYRERHTQFLDGGQEEETATEVVV